jgi:hypothetical protein
VVRRGSSWSAGGDSSGVARPRVVCPGWFARGGPPEVGLPGWFAGSGPPESGVCPGWLVGSFAGSGPPESGVCPGWLVGSFAGSGPPESGVCAGLVSPGRWSGVVRPSVVCRVAGTSRVTSRSGSVEIGPGRCISHASRSAGIWSVEGAFVEAPAGGLPGRRRVTRCRRTRRARPPSLYRGRG